MIKVFSGLYDRYFSEEEAIIFSLLLVAGTLIMLTMGGVIAPLLWSMVLTFMLQGLVNSLVKINVPRRFAVYFVYLVFLGLTLVIFLIFLPFSWSRLTAFFNELPSMVNQLRSLLLLLPENYPEFFTETQVEEWLQNMQGEIGQLGQVILSYSVSSITRLATLVVYTVLVPIMVFFMLKDSEKLLNFLESWLPKKRPIMAQVWHEMNDQLANYIRGKALEILIVGITSYLLFSFLGLNYPLLLAVLVGFSVIVPYVGALVVTVPVFLVGFFQWGFTGDLLQVLIAYAILQLIDGNILVPLIFSETVNLHPIAIITAVLVFGGLWGFWGVFFAIPLATFFKAVIKAWPVSASSERAGSS
ncbi:MAG: putative permease [Pseudohongiellaceae bacterium]|jgi:putative permease|tara:strand:+ start:44 stop:1117 length:1074 start_codon:yes stop_codon:yes gene_type:complete